MRKTLAVVVLAAATAAVAAFAVGAWSASPPTPAERALQKDVKALKAQVKKLQSDVKTLKATDAELELVALGSLGLVMCSLAITADAFQGTWQIVDQLSTATQAGKTYFGPQAPVDDTVEGQSLCQVLEVTRSQALPPTTAPFSAMLALLRS